MVSTHAVRTLRGHAASVSYREQQSTARGAGRCCWHSPSTSQEQWPPIRGDFVADPMRLCSMYAHASGRPDAISRRCALPLPPRCGSGAPLAECDPPSGPPALPADGDHTPRLCCGGSQQVQRGQVAHFSFCRRSASLLRCLDSDGGRFGSTLSPSSTAS